VRSSVYLTCVTGREDVLDALPTELPAVDVDRRKPYSVWLHFDRVDPFEARGLVATALERLHPDAGPGDYLF
jgi:hypothetical protein